MADPKRLRVTVCYIRDARDSIFSLDERARALGVDYVEVSERHSFDWRILPALRSLIRDRHIDIVHSHEYKTDLLAWLLARQTGVATLATAHGWTGHSSRERLLYYPMNKRLLSRFPLVLAVSSEIRNELVARGAEPERVRVLLNGIDHGAFRRDRDRTGLNRQQLGLHPGEIAIGAVGRLEPQKRFDLLLEAFAALHAEHPQVRLLIAGEGSERRALLSAIASRRLESVCRLLGHYEDIVGLHHALDLFVQSSAYEGTPNVVLEAMALETPVVATDVGGTAEVCRPGVDGLIVPSGSSSVLANAVREVLASKVSAVERVRSARHRVETDLSFERRCRLLEDVYDELVLNRAAA